MEKGKLFKTKQRLQKHLATFNKNAANQLAKNRDE